MKEFSEDNPRFVSEADYYAPGQYDWCEHPSEWISEEFGGPNRRDGSGPTYYVCGKCGAVLGETGRRDSVL